jgi:hypothetical protein
MRCSKCGTKGADVAAVSIPRIRGRGFVREDRCGREGSEAQHRAAAPHTLPHGLSSKQSICRSSKFHIRL